MFQFGSSSEPWEKEKRDRHFTYVAADDTETWSFMSDGVCTQAFEQYPDYVFFLARAEKNNIEAALSPEIQTVNDAGTILVSDNIRAHTDIGYSLPLESYMRLWDLGQQRYVATSSFTRAGGRDQLLASTDLSTRKRVFVCRNDMTWDVTTDSSMHGYWTDNGQTRHKVLQRDDSLLDRHLSSSHAHASNIVNMEEQKWEFLTSGLMKMIIQSGSNGEMPSIGSLVTFNCCMSTASGGKIIDSTFVEDGGSGPICLILDETKMLVGIVKALCSMSINEISQFKVTTPLHYGHEDCTHELLGNNMYICKIQLLHFSAVKAPDKNVGLKETFCKKYLYRKPTNEERGKKIAEDHSESQHPITIPEGGDHSRMVLPGLRDRYFGGRDHSSIPVEDDPEITHSGSEANNARNIADVRDPPRYMAESFRRGFDLLVWGSVILFDKRAGVDPEHSPWRYTVLVWSGLISIMLGAVLMLFYPRFENLRQDGHVFYWFILYVTSLVAALGFLR